MKQWITEDQFNELTKKQKDIWFKWCWKHKYTMKDRFPFDYYKDKPKMTLGFPSIGEMIEFLDEQTKDIEHFSIRMGRASDGFSFPKGTLITHIDGLGIEIEDEPDLCDALWEGVKERL